MNQAVRFRQLDHHSAFVGALGTDEAGERIATLLNNEKIDTTCLQRIDGFTARNQIVNDSSGERFGVEGAWESGVYEQYCVTQDIWDYLQKFDIWATHANCPFYHEALERKKR